MNPNIARLAASLVSTANALAIALLEDYAEAGGTVTIARVVADAAAATPTPPAPAAAPPAAPKPAPVKRAKTPDPAASERMRKVWAKRKAKAAKAAKAAAAAEPAATE